MSSLRQLSIGAFVGACAFASAGAQIVPGRPATVPLTSAPAAPIVEIVELSATPAAPKVGEMVTIKLSMRNAGTTTVANLPWALQWHTGGQTLAQGTQTNVGPGARFEVTGSWKAVAGTQLMKGYIDPANTIKNGAPITSRIRDLTLTIAQISASTLGTAAPAPVMETQRLDYSKAKNAGAGSSAVLRPGAPAACAAYGVNEQDTAALSQVGSVYLNLDCVGGVTVDVEVFKNFRLKNGWKVKSSGISRVGPNMTWQYVTKSTELSTEPRTVLRLTGASTYLVLDVQIIGPAGTDPYTGRATP